jgi:aminopeptidase N
VIALFALFLAVSPASAQRLPPGVTPEHYDLWFAPDFKTDSFRGRASIDVNVEKPIRTITLHSAELKFGEAEVMAGGKKLTAKVTFDEKSETATLTLPQEIPAGPAKITAAYTGILNDKLRGFYLSKANNRKYAVTQMEATDARRAFPSFDEPAYKATFDITLMVDEGDTAISNGPQKSDTPGPERGKHTVTFGRTKKMSTYLVAMLVGDFACRDGKSDDIPIRVCSTPDKKALTGFALEAAEQQLAFYNKYYDIKYPFEKLDIIGIPDFAAGAMENTGAITFREQYLLADPERASLETRKNVAAVLSHEIAHQWFGDLVTMKWWDDIWLNEGFATWMANKPLAAWKPDWDVELDDVQATQKALALDALRGTRAIRTKVETPEEINEVFDAIAYEKSAGVLRMVESYVGEDAFRKGVASYIKKHAYGNAAAEDFWSEVTRVTGKPVDKIMSTYVDQPGVPVLGVTSACAGATTEVTIEQERFFGAPGEKPAAQQAWTIPICFKAFPDSPATCSVIAKAKETLSVPGCAAEAFVNAGSVGYFFTDYSPETVRALSRKARGTLTPAERVGLIGDEWWMVRSARHNIGAFLDLAGALAADTTPAVTDALASRLDYVADYLVAPDERARFESWVRARFGPALDRMGIPGDKRDDLEDSRRATLLELVGVWGASPEVQHKARALATKYIADRSVLPGTLTPAVLRVAAYGGDAALYDRYVAQLKKVEANPEEYYRFVDALPYFRDPALIKRTLSFAVSPNFRTQDTGQLLAMMMTRPWSRDATWAFVKKEWSTLVTKLGTFQGIPAIVGASGAFCSQEAATDVKTFFAKNPVESAERGIKIAVERIESCGAVRGRQAQPLKKWLEDTP